MNEHMQERGYGFVIGLVAGAVVGAGLATWLAPQASALRRRVADSAAGLGVRVGEAVDELTLRSDDVRNEVADIVVGGAREVERFATAAKAARPASGG
jgi:gas vesicle protein